jgi:hypothetical protein
MYKTLVLTGATVGGIIGAYIPSLFGDTEMFSAWSILGSTIGAFVGIWLGYLLAKRIA